MARTLVLLHSLCLGPGTWRPVARSLHAAGERNVVPDLRGFADSGRPYWPHVIDTVNAALQQLDSQRPVVLVAHSNVGRLVPLIIQSAVRPVTGAVFVDAALPARTGPTPLATASRLAELRALAVNGRLPRWTDWGDDEHVTQMLPDPRLRAAIIAEQPELPLAFYEQLLPATADANPADGFGYLLFSEQYESHALDAQERGWLVEREPGLHLHQAVAPDAVARRLARMAGQLAPAS